MTAADELLTTAPKEDIALLDDELDESVVATQPLKIAAPSSAKKGLNTPGK
jgi:hypothetical protein